MTGDPSVKSLICQVAKRERDAVLRPAVHGYVHGTDPLLILSHRDDLGTELTTLQSVLALGRGRSQSRRKSDRRFLFLRSTDAGRRRFSAPSLLQRASYLSYLGLLNPDQTVDVEILRDGQTALHRIRLTTTRTRVQDQTVDMQWHIEKGNDLGHFRFDIWPHSDSMGPLQQELDRFFSAVRQEGVSNIVFDWRSRARTPGSTGLSSATSTPVVQLLHHRVHGPH